MRVVIVSALSTGGAAVAATRLHNGLIERDVDSTMVLPRGRKVAAPHTTTLGHDSRLGRRILRKFNSAASRFGLGKTASRTRYLRSRPTQWEPFTFPYSDYDIAAHPAVRDADVVNLHWVARFLDYPTFFRRCSKPIVWTLHDMNPFLGGEHFSPSVYAGDLVPESRESDILRDKYLADLKRAALQSVDTLHVVSPSHWLCEASKNSRVLGRFPHHVIPYGLDSQLFKPWPKSTCRDILNLPTEGHIVLFVSQLLANPRKGYQFLEEAIGIAQKQSRDTHFVAIGRSQETKSSRHATVQNLGAISDDRLMAIAYAAADIFVLPSLADNLPNTMLESLMCGTPVVAFPVGGIPEAVKHLENGILCDEFSGESLAKGIVDALERLDQWNSLQIHENARRKYSLEVQAAAYQSLFRGIVDGRVCASTDSHLGE